jgi:hypothetical protein
MRCWVPSDVPWVRETDVYERLCAIVALDACAQLLPYKAEPDTLPSAAPQRNQGVRALAIVLTSPGASSGTTLNTRLPVWFSRCNHRRIQAHKHVNKSIISARITCIHPGTTGSMLVR